MQASSFLKWFAPKLKQPDNKEVIAATRTTIGKCNICGETLDNHEYWNLASEIGVPGTSKTYLGDLVDHHEWSKASAVHEWQHDKDITEYLLLRCPKKGKIALLKLLCTPGLYSPDLVQGGDILGAEDCSAISILVGNEWVHF